MPEPVREETRQPEAEPEPRAPAAVPAPAAAPALAQRVLALQRGAGNAAVSRWLTASARQVAATGQPPLRPRRRAAPRPRPWCRACPTSS